MALRDTPPPEVPAERIRELADLLDNTPLLLEPQLALTEWAAGYYHAPIGECVRLAVPVSLDVEAERRIERTGRPASAPLSPVASALLGQVHHAGSVAAGELLRGVAGATYGALAELEAAGVVVSSYGSSGPRVRARTEAWVERAVAELPPGRRGAAQQRLFDALERGASRVADLLREAQAGRASLTSLVETGAVREWTVEVDRDPFADLAAEPRRHDPELTEAQAAAVAAIEGAISTRGTSAFLLEGVTGSGKTEVYLRATRCALAAGGRALILLPEIGLTPQFVSAFRAAIGAPIAVLHSGLGRGERHDEWRRIRRGEARVVIGARSALFAPVEELRVIVVDEEHDSSFKQDEGVRYHARDLAIVLGRSVGAPVVLGSATPSLESVGNVRRGRYVHLRLPARVGGRPMPDIELIDMRTCPADPADPASLLFSPRLQAEIRRTVAGGEQAIVFLNRRGFASALVCEGCGDAISCRECDVAMTFHRREGALRCHYCGARTQVPRRCPSCGTTELERSGAGTERAEESLEAAFKDLRVGRLDRDTARGHGIRRILDAFRTRQIDVLVGTQMLAKGHDFPAVTLVGVLDADQALRMPDFRGGERAYQLLTQVSGRAGRAERPGRVLIQTFRPDHPVLEAVRRHDGASFVERELEWRRRTGYPPFGFIVLVRCDGPDAARTHAYASSLADIARTAAPGVGVFGPVPATLARIAGRHRIQLMLRSPNRELLHRAAAAIAARLDPRDSRGGRDVRAVIDVDPLSVL
jgi:primosomal protein N' (replication factor Y)